MPKKNPAVELAAASPELEEAKKHIETGTIAFDGKTYSGLHYTFNDLAEYESITGKSLLVGGDSIIEKPTFNGVRIMLYLALKRASALNGSAPYTLEEVGDQLDMRYIWEMWAVLLAAFKKSSRRSNDANPPKAEEAAQK